MRHGTPDSQRDKVFSLFASHDTSSALHGLAENDGKGASEDQDRVGADRRLSDRILQRKELLVQPEIR